MRHRQQGLVRHRVLQRRHPLAVDLAGCFGWIIQRNQRVVIAAVRLGKGGGRDVGGERPDVPRADAENVCHG